MTELLNEGQMSPALKKLVKKIQQNKNSNLTHNVTKNLANHPRHCFPTKPCKINLKL